MRFQTHSAPNWTRTSTPFLAVDFKSTMSTISIMRAWLSGQGSNLRCVSQSHMCYHYTTRQYKVPTERFELSIKTDFESVVYASSTT